VYTRPAPSVSVAAPQSEQTSSVTFSASTTPHLQVNATLAYTDAHLTSLAANAASNPQDNGKVGDQLPQNPRVTGSLLIDYSRPLDARMSFFMRGLYQYKDMVNTQFSGGVLG
jgi:outer membrane receptor protein involved in Fe transport